MIGELFTRRTEVLVSTLASLAILAFLALLLRGHTTEDARATDRDCGTTDLAARIDQLTQEVSRFIAVVGDGVPSSSFVKKRPYNAQFAQGYDLWQGAKWAIAKGVAAARILDDPSASSEVHQSAPHLVGLLPIDDGGNSTCAARIGQILSAKPKLIGVIGHSTTSTTRAALPFYKRARVPVLVPAATNPQLLVDHTDHSFRLPSNDEIQALVIADIITSRSNTAFIVWDATPEAEPYSEFLKTRITYHISTRKRRTQFELLGNFPVSLNPLNYSYLFRRILSSQPDIVLFVGYGSLAREFLFGLHYEYLQHPELSRPLVILTDGCKISGLEVYDFPTLLTFPAPPLYTTPEFSTFPPETTTATSDFSRTLAEESFELFGYDALILLHEAIKSQLPTLSRSDVLYNLRRLDDSPTAFSYAFRDGENIRHRYYVYDLQQMSINTYTEKAIGELYREMVAR